MLDGYPWSYCWLSAARFLGKTGTLSFPGQWDSERKGLPLCLPDMIVMWEADVLEEVENASDTLKMLE